jgi:hypothetical protein
MATTESRRPRRGPGPWTVVVTSVAAFLILLTFLAWQIRAGRDPALGGKGVAAPIPKKRVIVRRVVKRVVIDRVVRVPDVPQAGGGAPAAAPSGTVASGPVASGPAPQAAAPAVPAPSPAPAPAPVTRTS